MLMMMVEREGRGRKRMPDILGSGHVRLDSLIRADMAQALKEAVAHPNQVRTTPPFLSLYPPYL